MFRSLIGLTSRSIAALLLLAGLITCSSLGRAEPQGQATAPANLPGSLLQGRTAAEPQVLALDNSGYSLTPLLTVGDQVPLLTGRWDELIWDPAHSYAVAGKLDGMGWAAVEGGYALWVNHEIGETVQSQFSASAGGTFTGARVSLFRFDADWRCLGGRNFITSYSDLNGPYCINALEEGGFRQTWLNPKAGEGKYCSSTLFRGYGADPLYFPGEETGHGRAKVVYPDGRAVVLADTPVGSWENVVPLQAFAGRDETVILLLDDVQKAYLFMYVGRRSATDPWGLLSGETYVAALQLDGVFLPSSYGLTAGSSAQVNWTPVPREFYCGHATEIDKRTELFRISRDWCGEAGTRRATRFVRIEDGEEDVNEAGSVYFTTTGDDKGSVGSDANPDVYGHLWKLELNLANCPGLAGSLTCIAAGGPQTVISLDNLELHGRELFVQEDVTARAPTEAMSADGRSNSCWSLNLDSLLWQRRFAVNQFTEGLPILPSSGLAIWETTGVTALPASFAAGGLPGLLLNVQAHGISSAERLGGSYVEGGQLLLALPD